jgi:SAM-dependent methyltransferase
MTTNLPGFFQGTEMPTAGWWEALWSDPVAVLAAVGIKPDMEVVDLCSGDGWFTREIAKIARHVIAIDIDSELLEVARHRLAENKSMNCEFVTGDAYELATLVPGRADFIFMANAFHGVPDRLRLAGAVRATLRPDGLFAIVNWHRRPREETRILGEPRGPKDELRVPPQTTIEAVESGGLKLARLIEIPPYHYGAVFKLPPKLER